MAAGTFRGGFETLPYRAARRDAVPHDRPSAA